MTAPVPNRKIKTLTIDFSLYTDDDPSFKNELVLMMIDNIKELVESFASAKTANDMTEFRKTCHKVMSTLSIIDDQDLIAVIERLKNPANGNEGNELAAIFKNLCANIIDILTGELDTAQN
jgi:hypothetical protein